MDNVTRMLQAWRRGEAEAEEAAGQLYLELRRRARMHLRRERREHTFAPSDLIHEIYVRLARQHVAWANRQQFYATASRMMRRVLVDHARARGSRKRAGCKVTLDENLPGLAVEPVDVLAVDAALEQLAREDERQARLVELRFFGGLTLEEAAEALGMSAATANRDWRFARAWLTRQLRGAAGAPVSSRAKKTLRDP